MDSKELRGLYEAYSEVYASIEELYEGYMSPEKKIKPSPTRGSHQSGDMRKPYNDTMKRKDQLAISKGKPFNDRVKKDSPMQYKSNNEEVDIYDIVLSHLLDEGYAETAEAAESIMVNMSEEWRDSILDEAYVDYRKGKLSGGRSPQQVLKGKQELNKARAATRANYDLSTPENPDAAKFKARAAKAGKVGSEMDAHTSTAGKIGKALTPGLGNRPGASPRMAHGEPNTDRHQLARHARGQSSTKG